MNYSSQNLLFNSAVREEARRKLSGNWTEPVLAFLIYMLLGSIISVIPFLNIILMPPFVLGIYILFLNFFESDKAVIDDIFKGFNNIGKAIGLVIVMGLFVFLWSLLLIIPGIIAAIRYSQALYILAENPDIPIMEAISRSKEMMFGVKGKYFLLQLSFIGWAFLCLFTAGIGYLWLYPYIFTSNTIFYKDLKKHFYGDSTIITVEDEQKAITD